MRYSSPIYFVQTTEAERLPNGDYSPPKEFKTECFAHVSDMGDDTKQLLFNDIKEQAVVIRIQNDYTDPITHIEWDNKKWKVLRKMTFRRDASFECGEL